MSIKKYYGYPGKPGFTHCFTFDKPIGAIEAEGPCPSKDHILHPDGTWLLDPKITRDTNKK